MHSVLVDTQSEAQSALEPELPPGTGVVTVPKLSLAGHMDPPVVHHGGAPQLAAIVPVRGAGGVGCALEGEGEDALLAHSGSRAHSAGPLCVSSCSGGGGRSGGGTLLLASQCSVCGAPAADHLHYGALSCYSCR